MMKGISPDFLGGHPDILIDFQSYMTAGVLYVYDVSISNYCVVNVTIYLINTEVH